MTIQELYDWARENNVETYEIVYFDDGCRYYPYYNDLEIDENRLEVSL